MVKSKKDLITFNSIRRQNLLDSNTLELRDTAVHLVGQSIVELQSCTSVIITYGLLCASLL